jgi:hypothetical protein
MADTPIYKRPAPAVGLAIATGVAAHAASVNAAKALGRSTALVAIVMTLIVMTIFYFATH